VTTCRFLLFLCFPTASAAAGLLCRSPDRRSGRRVLHLVCHGV